MSLKIRIVLVETSHPGNIGASARAMKTMGFDDLVLVAPKEFPCAEATARASGADDVLSKARVVASLSEAIADCGFVVGASARSRSLPWPIIDPRRCADTVVREAAATTVAIVLGPEHSGLTNEDLGRCQLLVQIPANPDYSSLNLAMAVQVLCYEIRMAGINATEDAAPASTETRDAPPATAGDLEGFHSHLEDVLTAVGFLKADHPKQLKLRLRRLFHRARPDQVEINILRGVVAALDPRSEREQENGK
ncbi:MAG: tRNA (cytosine(32)/uridine(32)-2'-O)-methyltransferase TrmJ [Candidatus Rariloculaceae bacterium]